MTDATMEACWLAAALLVPLRVEVLSVLPYAAPRVWLLRSLAAVAVIAAIANLVVVPLERRSLREVIRHPIAAAALALLAIAVLSTALSVAPYDSLWGSWERRGGVATLSAIMALGGLVAWKLRTISQWRRLRDAVIAAGMVGALHALAQAFGLDPLQLSEWRRPDGLAGNPIFLSAWLLLPTALAAERWAEARARSPRRPLLAIGILLLLVAGTVVTQSRGPLLGLGAGGIAWLLAVRGPVTRPGRARRLRTTSAVLLAAALLAAIGLTAFGDRGDSTLASLGRVFQPPSAERGTAGVRLAIWRSVGDLWLTDGSRLDASIVPRLPAGARRWVGWGPESMQGVLPAYQGTDLVRLEGVRRVADRAHNDFLDALATTGSAGLLALAALYATVLRTGVIHARSVRPGAMRMLVMAAAGAAGLGLAVGPGLQWFGLGIGVGLAGATLALLALAPPARAATSSSARSIAAALAAGAIAHLVETQTGIATPVTLLGFALCAGGLVALGRGLQEGRATSPAKGDDAARGTLAALTVLAAGVVYLPIAGLGQAPVGSPVARTLIAVLAAAAACLALAPLAPGAGPRSGGSTRRLAPAAAGTLVVTAGGVLLTRAALPGSIGPSTDPAPYVALGQMHQAALLAGVAALVVALLARGDAGGRSRLLRGAAGLSVAAVLVSSGWLVARTLPAEVALRVAARSREPLVPVAFRVAAAASPHRAAPSFELARVLLALAPQDEPLKAGEMLAESVEALSAAIVAEPLDAAGWSARAQAHLRLARLATDASDRRGHLEMARLDARQTLRLNPLWPEARLWLDRAEAALTATGSSSRE